jgi:sterol desaturase/sphingolipid hydroxylase (fatty acid hydroxylase superfamily)
MTRQARAAARRARPPLEQAARDRTLRDLVTYHKTRKLLLIWVPFAAALTALALVYGLTLWEGIAGFVTGVLGYSLLEYLAHRYVYHWTPQSRILRRLTGDLARLHLGHHREPAQYGGSINGNQLPILGFALVMALSVILIPFYPTAFCLFAIAVGGLNYMVQEFVHFGTHQMPMHNRLLAIQKRHHMLHHYRDDDCNFGLFWPFWDYVFRTDFRSVQRRKARRRAG